MELSEIIRRAEKELATAMRNLERAKQRGAPEKDVQNLEAKVEYRKAVLETLKSGPCGLCAYNPPSSMDGKPCCVCPASIRR